MIVGAVRTPIGKYGGSLKDIPASHLAASVVREAGKRSGVKPEDVGHVVLGNVIHTETKDMYMSRVAAVNAGIPVETPALTLNRLCGSGLQAIVTASQMIELGEIEVAVAGGVECMSRSQYWIPGMRWGQRMNDAVMIDAMVGALTDPFDQVHWESGGERHRQMGHLAAGSGRLAAECQRRRAVCHQHCIFNEQILPIELKSKGGTTLFDTDEQPRADATVDALAKLKPAFDKHGTVTPGNASTINDGAAAVVLMERSTAEQRGLRPLGRLAGATVVGVEPKYMGIGPVPATRKLLARTGLKLEDIDLFEVNEAFAAQALAVMRELELPPERQSERQRNFSGTSRRRDRSCPDRESSL